VGAWCEGESPPRAADARALRLGALFVGLHSSATHRSTSSTNEHELVLIIASLGDAPAGGGAFLPASG